MTFPLKIINILLAIVICTCNKAIAQTTEGLSGVRSVPFNFTCFTTVKNFTDNSFVNSKATLITEADGVSSYVNRPSVSAIEVMEKRTINSKYFIDKDTASKFYIIKSLNAIHYKKNGKWLTIDKRIAPKGNNIFEASCQQNPVGFDMNRKMSYIKFALNTVYFNNWVLRGLTSGKEETVAKPNWSDYTIGDEGVYIKNFFPGIDAQMCVMQGAIKTNFIVNENKFTGVEKIIFKDSFHNTSGGLFNIGNDLNLLKDEADFVIGNNNRLHIDKAILYEQKNPKTTSTFLKYRLTSNTIAFSIETAYLDTLLRSGKVIIDPLVTSSGSLAAGSISGSGTAGGWCDNILQVATPVAATITGVFYSFSIHSNNGSTGNDIRNSISSGSCTTGPLSCCTTCSGGAACYTTNASVGTYQAGGIGYSPLNFLGCMPAPSCVAQNVSFDVRVWSTFSAGGGCSNYYAYPDNPFIIRIEGHTVELSSINSSAASICAGQNVSLFGAGVYGVPPYTYSWDNNAGNMNTVKVSPPTPVTYALTITDQCNNIATGQVSINVNPLPSITSATSNMPVCSGNQLALSSVSSVANSAYSWTGPNGFVSNLQSPVIDIVALNATGDYTVIASSNGCSSLPVKTAVIVKPTPAIVSANSNAPLCADASGVTLLLNAQSSLANSSFTWAGPNSFTSDNASPFILNANTTSSGIYIVTATLNGCTSAAYNVNVIINPIPVITSGSNSPVCDTKNLVFFATSSLPVSSFSWSGVNNFSSNLESPQIANASIDTASGRYFVAATKDGCTSKADTLNVIINPNPVVKFGTPYVCDNVSGTYKSACTISDGSEAAFSYRWMFDDGTLNTDTLTTTHSYATSGIHTSTLQITSNNGCSSALGQPVTVSGHPKIQLGLNKSVCSNAIVQLQNNSSLDFGKINQFIYWKDSSVNSDSVIDKAPVDSERYMFSYPAFGNPADINRIIKTRVFSDAGCYSDQTNTMKILAAPRLMFSRVPLLCSAHSGNYVLNYAIDSSSLKGIGYYSGNGITFPNQLNAAIAGVGTHPVQYNYTVSNGCTDSVVQFITIGNPAIINTGNDVTILTEGTAFLHVNVSGGSSLSYVWSPATGLSDSSISNPKAIIENDTRFKVAVTNEYSCISTGYVNVKITDLLFIPNAFTPNGDGINDGWQIDYLSSYPNCDVSIFNRYGQLIYKTTGYDTQWDGKYHGIDIPVGTYYYLINTKRKKGILSGSITILR